MADVTFAHALAVVRALSRKDQARLRQWLAAQEGQHASQLENDTEPPPNWYTCEMHWLRAHQAVYAGQWVALDGERLLSHSTEMHQVYAEAHAAGVAVPFVAYIDTPDTEQWGGWL